MNWLTWESWVEDLLVYRVLTFLDSNVQSKPSTAQNGSFEFWCWQPSPEGVRAIKKESSKLYGGVVTEKITNYEYIICIIQWMLVSQTLDRQILDTTYPRYN